MKKKSRVTLRELLFGAFANSEYCDSQDPSVFWAIDEGRRRVFDFQYYTTPKANKEHTCVRSCQIHAGQIYFHAPGVDGLKICAGCMAMILYYLGVWDLPVYEFDYWDDEVKRPHWDPNGTMSKRMAELSSRLPPLKE